MTAAVLLCAVAVAAAFVVGRWSATTCGIAPDAGAVQTAPGGTGSLVTPGPTR